MATDSKPKASAPTNAPISASTLGSMQRAINDKNIIICCGAGGVGKTTVAAALGAAVVSHLGKRVLVLTIDPARRLATALGLEAVGNVATQVEGIGHGTRAKAKSSRGELPGELWMAMLDTSASWDDLVRKHAPDEVTRDKILANPLYRNITQRFVQSHDYIAMERLYELRAGGEFDLIIIDTPPSRHALDFLDAPERMADFFSSALLRWITMPYRLGGAKAGRLGYLASKPFYQIADRILGSQFLEDIAEFFLLFQSMYGGFVQRATSVKKLLHDDGTTFVVISSLDAAPLNEAEFFVKELTKRGHHLGALVLNRVLPDWFNDPKAQKLARKITRASESESSVYGSAEELKVLQSVAESFLRFSALADLEDDIAARLSTKPEVLVRIPLQDRDISDAAGLASFGELLWSQ